MINLYPLVGQTNQGSPRMPQVLDNETEQLKLDPIALDEWMLISSDPGTADQSCKRNGTKKATGNG